MTGSACTLCAYIAPLHLSSGRHRYSLSPSAQVLYHSSHVLCMQGHVALWRPCSPAGSGPCPATHATCFFHKHALRVQGHVAPVVAVGWSFDGQLLTSVDCDGVVIVWRRERPAPVT